MLNSGPIEARLDEKTNKKYLIDKSRITTDGISKSTGHHPIAGYTKRSLLYDTLGYIDREVEKYYANWSIEELVDKNTGKIKVRAKIKDNIQNTDIYNGLYDL